MINDNENSGKGLGWIELSESFMHKGCPVCYAVLKSLRRYFEYLLYEFATDAYVHKIIISSFGMCNVHACLLEEIEDRLTSDGLNIAVLYETTIQREIKLLSNLEIQNNNKKNSYVLFKSKNNFGKKKKEVLNELMPKELCPACKQQKESESFYIHEIIRLYKDQNFRNKYEQNKILMCKKHFLLLIEEIKSENAYDYFVKKQKEKLTSLYNNLKQFIEKHNYQSKESFTEEELNSWQKIISYFSSDKNISQEGYRKEYF